MPTTTARPSPVGCHEGPGQAWSEAFLVKGSRRDQAELQPTSSFLRLGVNYSFDSKAERLAFLFILLSFAGTSFGSRRALPARPPQPAPALPAASASSRRRHRACAFTPSLPSPPRAHIRVPALAPPAPPRRCPLRGLPIKFCCERAGERAAAAQPAPPASPTPGPVPPPAGRPPRFVPGGSGPPGEGGRPGGRGGRGGSGVSSAESGLGALWFGVAVEGRGGEVEGGTGPLGNLEGPRPLPAARARR